MPLIVASGRGDAEEQASDIEVKPRDWRRHAGNQQTCKLAESLVKATM